MQNGGREDVQAATFEKVNNALIDTKRNNNDNIKNYDNSNYYYYYYLLSCCPT